MEDYNETPIILKPSINGDGAQMPTYDELFCLIRAAGPSNPAKARAVDRALARARELIKQSYDQVDAMHLERWRSRSTDANTDAASLSVSERIVKVVGPLLAKAPHWVRQDFNSGNLAVRLRAEDTLAAMIAVSLASEVGL